MTCGLVHLKRRADYLRVARQGRSWAAPGLILQVRRHVTSNDEAAIEGAMRVGVTVSRKVGKAVVRNRVRRRLRAVARSVLTAQAALGCDYVLIGRAKSAERPFAALEQDLVAALRRLGVDRAVAAAPNRLESH